MRAQRVATQAGAIPERAGEALRRCAYAACGAEFTPRRSWQKYHTAGCRYRAYSQSQRAPGKGGNPVAEVASRVTVVVTVSLRED